MLNQLQFYVFSLGHCFVVVAAVVVVLLSLLLLLLLQLLFVSAFVLFLKRTQRHEHTPFLNFVLDANGHN